MIEANKDKIKLTQTVQKGGCAAKVAAIELRQILAKVHFPKLQDHILVDGGLMDDAAIIRINADLALVQTLDFFTPIVDSAYVFGQIAAANSLSDVYAMGGKVQTAMAILAFPTAQFSHDLIAEVLQGASDKIAEAQANFVGGHSIDDDTLKFGLSVTGTVHPDRIWKNSNAQVGDVLILTKALGTGTATAALKRQEVLEIDIQVELESMAQLNNILDDINQTTNHEAMQSAIHAAIHSATDITGFGLAGHAVQMARASDKKFIFDFNQIPHFKNTLNFLEKGFLTKAHRTNKEYTENEIQIDGLSLTESQLLFDPQTSGGLLLSVAPEMSEKVISLLRKKRLFTTQVGVVKESLTEDSVRMHVQKTLKI